MVKIEPTSIEITKSTNISTDASKASSEKPSSYFKAIGLSSFLTNLPRTLLAGILTFGAAFFMTAMQAATDNRAIASGISKNGKHPLPDLIMDTTPYWNINVRPIGSLTLSSFSLLLLLSCLFTIVSNITVQVKEISAHCVFFADSCGCFPYRTSFDPFRFCALPCHQVMSRANVIMLNATGSVFPPCFSSSWAK